MNPARPPLFKTALALATLATCGAVASIGVLARHTTPAITLYGDPNVTFTGTWPEHPDTLPAARLVQAPGKPDYTALATHLGLPKQGWSNNEQGTLTMRDGDRRLLRLDEPVPALSYLTPAATHTLTSIPTATPADDHASEPAASSTPADPGAPSAPADLPVGHSRDDGHDHGDPTPEEVRAVGELRTLLRLAGGDPTQWAIRAVAAKNGFHVLGYPRIGSDPITAPTLTASVTVQNGKTIHAYLPVASVAPDNSIEVRPAQEAFEQVTKHRAGTEVERGEYTDAEFGWTTLTNPNDLGERTVTPAWFFTNNAGQRIVISADPTRATWPST